MASQKMSRGLVLLFAIACGVAVANLYYAQPLLESLARSFRVPNASTALIVTLSQLGYVIGLVLIVPLADLVERRRLIVAMLVVSSAALAVSALAPSLMALEAASALVGVTSVVAQILVPLAADMSNDETRGRVVGTVMGGLLLGILVARVASGGVAQLLGWRAVYWFASALVLIMALFLRLFVPLSKKAVTLSYGGLLKSTFQLFVKEPVLRRRSLYGSLGFAAFSVLWTTLAYLLAGSPYRFSSLTIGAFGLIGAAGAIVANIAGRLSDAGRTRMTTGIFAGGITTSFLFLWLGANQIGLVVLGIVILDLGVQGLQITNQATIYKLSPNARGRVTSAYMTVYFLGGAAGSLAGGILYSIGGWPLSCALGLAFGSALVLLWLFEERESLPKSQLSGSK